MLVKIGKEISKETPFIGLKIVYRKLNGYRLAN